MPLSSYISIARRWWWLTLLGCLLAGAAAYFVTDRMTPIYEAKAVLLVNQAQSPGSVTYQDILGSQQLTTTYAEIATTTGNLERAALGLEDTGLTADGLKDRVAARSVRETQLIEITAEDPSPERAARIANAVAESFPSYIEEAQLAGSSGETRSLNTVFVAERAVAPGTPVRPNTILNITLGAVLGLVVTVVIVALLEYLDDGVDNREDVEDLGVPFLGSIVHAQRPKGADKKLWVPSISQSDALQPLAESYRQLQISLAFALTATESRVIVVTSSGPGEGKSTTAANLAQALAESSKKVLLIDGDLRKPDVQRYFPMSNSSGLSSSFLTDRSALPSFVKVVNDRLHVLTSGPVPPNPVELLSSQRLADGIRDLAREFDLVVIDTPPALGLADTSIWATVADGILIVARSDKTRRGALAETISVMRASHKPIIGVVMNGADAKRNHGYYGYGYAYGYRQQERPES